MSTYAVSMDGPPAIVPDVRWNAGRPPPSSAATDLATVSRFLLHATVAMSQRDAAGAMQDVDRAAAALEGKLIASTLVASSLVANTRQ